MTTPDPDPDPDPDPALALAEHRPYLRRIAGVRFDDRLRGRVDESDLGQDALADAAREYATFSAAPPMPVRLWLRQLLLDALTAARRRHLVADGRPILAKRIGPLGQQWRWAKRHPVIAGLSAAVFVSLTLGLAGVYWQWRQAEANLKQAEANAAETKRVQAEAMAKVRTFYTGMDHLDEFMTFGASDKTSSKLLAQRWEAFRPVLAVYDDFLQEPADDPEVFALQVHALFQRGSLLNRFRRFEQAEADCRRAADWYPRIPPDDPLEANLHLVWALAASNHSDAVVRAEVDARVRGWVTPRLNDKQLRERWAFVLVQQAMGPLVVADPTAACDRVVEAFDLFQSLSPGHVALVTAPGTSGVGSHLGVFCHLCFSVCDVKAVADLAERRHAAGDWYGAAVLWAKCCHEGTDEADEYKAKSLAALELEVKKRPHPHTQIAVHADFKPFVKEKQFMLIRKIISDATSSNLPKPPTTPRK